MVRIDDLDTPRNRPGANQAILSCLERFGLEWDGPIDYQSQHLDQYQAAIAQLSSQQQVYPCYCSRKQLNNHADQYPGFCRHHPPETGAESALRLKTYPGQISFTDRLHGLICEDLAASQGDFVIQRKDRIFAYQLAVVVDDHRQQINQVVRGYDLLESTPKQIYLQQLLGYLQPNYLHVPILVDAQGQKLSKQSFAQAVDPSQPVKTLWTLLGLLKQQPPQNLLNASLQEVLDWAVLNWRPEQLKTITKLSAPPIA